MRSSAILQVHIGAKHWLADVIEDNQVSSACSAVTTQLCSLLKPM